METLEDFHAMAFFALLVLIAQVLDGKLLAERTQNVVLVALPRTWVRPFAEKERLKVLPFRSGWASLLDLLVWFYKSLQLKI